MEALMRLEFWAFFVGPWPWYYYVLPALGGVIGAIVAEGLSLPVVARAMMQALFLMVLVYGVRCWLVRQRR
jgi:hypothetical protein